MTTVRAVPVLRDDTGRAFRGVILAAVVLGLFFRFYHLDHKVFWDDEVYSAMRVLGLSEAEVGVRASRTSDAAALNELIHPARSAESKGVWDTLRGLAAEEPQHAPLYYVLGHAWTRLAGTSVTALRSLSAIAGSIALPCMFWLCLELYRSRAAAWVGVALLALAPVQVLYSQEAREYSLWIVASLAISAAFLRAMRTGTTAAWLLYALLLGAALYTYPLTAFLGLAHLTFFATVQGKRGLNSFLPPLLATGAAFAAFAPWLWLIVRNLGQVDRSMATILGPKVSALHVLRTFLGMLRFDFLDFNIVHASRLNAALSILPIVLTGYAIYFARRHLQRRTCSFILLAMAFSVAPIVLPDLLGSGLRTENTRYFLPLYAFIDVALVGLIVSHTTLTWAEFARKPLWAVVAISVLLGRAASCAVSAQAETWWNKFDETSISVARVINATSRPVVVSDAYVGYALSLAGYLDGGTRVVLRPRCYLCTRNGLESSAVPLPPRADWGTVFALGPSAALQAKLHVALQGRPADYRCIDVRDNCASNLSLWVTASR